MALASCRGHSNQGHAALFHEICPALRCRTRRPCGARPDKRIGPVIVPPAGGQLPCLVRQASVRFSDDFAVFQVQRPGFCDQLANTCEPASGFGGTVRNIRRLHDETPDKWWIRDNPNHKETSPLCEMRFRYMRITDTLCCCHATRRAPMRTVVASRRDEAVASTASHRGNGKKGGQPGRMSGGSTAIRRRSTRIATTAGASPRAAYARARCPARAGSRATSR